MTRAAALLVAIACLAVPSVVHACPVCFDANEANRTAFVVTTIFLSILPLSLVAGIVLWLRDRAEESGGGTGAG